MMDEEDMLVIVAAAVWALHNTKKIDELNPVEALGFAGIALKAVKDERAALFGGNDDVSN
jgi:hypothetical protein